MFKKYRLSALASVFTGSAIILALNGCGESKTGKAEKRITEGRELSEKYCASCHKYPGPELLDKATWEKRVLPAMAIQLGIQHGMGQYYNDTHSVLAVDDYFKIIEFYKKIAPARLSVPRRKAVQDWAVFALKRPVAADTGKIAMTTMVRFNRFDKRIYTGGVDSNLFRWDAGLNAELVKKMPSAVTAAHFYQTNGSKNKGVFTCIGVLAPNDYLKGSLEELEPDHKDVSNQLLADSLPRPVQTVAGDFDNDGLTDYIVCGYGNTKGALYMIQQQAGGKFIKRVIRAVPGAIQAEVGDFNHDGWLDVMCLFAQADEGIWMFTNNKKGGFFTRNLLRFPPVYGSNSFQLADMNNDGKKDIVYTCGDNNDYSTILKPYHGVYIFTDQGGDRFKQTYFNHINGASKAMAADFDGDGDMDIAAIAFFADFKYNPTEGFIYLEQTGTNKFKAHEVPVNKYGRWLAMEVADADGDGDQDVILGNFSVFSNGLINQKDYKPDWDIHQPIIMLENKIK